MKSRITHAMFAVIGVFSRRHTCAGEIKIGGKPEKLVKTLKISKLLVRREKLKVMKRTRQNAESKTNSWFDV